MIFIGLHQSGEVAAQGKKANLGRDREPKIVASQHGTVRDASGNPVVGATVRLCDLWSAPDSYYRNARHSILATVETNERGEFSFRDVKGHFRREREIDRPYWYVTVTAAGQGMALSRPTTEKDYENLAVVLQPAAIVKGRVVDDQNKPVAGASISAVTIEALGRRPERQGQDLHLGAWRPTVRTDADGRFQMDDLPKDRRIGLRIESDLFADEFAYAATTEVPQPDLPREKFLGVGADELVKWASRPVHAGDFTVTLQPGWELTGSVTNADSGDPIPEARVSVSHWNYDRPSMTDAEGRFRISGIEFATMTLSVQAPSDSDYVNRWRILQLQPDVRRPHVEVSLPRGVVVTGTVLSERTGRGVARVGVRDDTPFPVPTDTGADVFAAPRAARTRTDGRFRILLPPGKRPLRLFGPVAGFDLPEEHVSRSSKTPIPPEALQTVDVPVDSPVPEIRFSIGKGIVIVGLVTDPEGKPVDGAEVRVVDDFARTIDLEKSQTDRQGKFRITGIPAKTGLRMVVIHTERQLCGRIELDPTENEESPQSRGIVRGVKLQPAGRIEGRVVDDARMPISGARVLLQELKEGDPNRPRMMRILRSKIETDADGRYAFDFLEPGREILLSVSKPGFEVPQQMFRSVMLEPAAKPEIVETILKPLK